MGGNTIVLQGPKNYGAWRVAVTNKIISKGCSSALVAKLANADPAEYSKLVAMGKSILATSINPALVEAVCDVKFTLVESFKLLEDMFGERTGSGGLALLDKLKGLKLREGDEPFMHVAAFESLTARLSTTDEKLSVASQTRYFLLSFPKSYYHVTSPLLKAGTADASTYNFATARKNIFEEIHLQIDLNATHDATAPAHPPMSSSNGETAFIGHKVTPQGREGVQCFHCGELGHFKGECPSWRSAQVKLGKDPDEEVRRMKERKNTRGGGRGGRGRYQGGRGGKGSGDRDRTENTPISDARNDTTKTGKDFRPEEKENEKGKGKAPAPNGGEGSSKRVGFAYAQVLDEVPEAQTPCVTGTERGPLTGELDPYALFAHAPPPTSNPWILDSGATSHLTGEDNIFHTFEQFSYQVMIKGISQNPIRAIGQGDVHFRQVIDGETSLFTAKNVLYVPGLPHNLFSATRCSKAGYKVMLELPKSQISREGVTYLTARFEGEQFLLDAHVVPPPPSPENRIFLSAFRAMAIDMEVLWHNRLGHADSRRVQQVSNGLVEGISANL